MLHLNRLPRFSGIVIEQKINESGRPVCNFSFRSNWDDSVKPDEIICSDLDGNKVSVDLSGEEIKHRTVSEWCYSALFPWETPMTFWSPRYINRDAFPELISALTERLPIPDAQKAKLKAALDLRGWVNETSSSARVPLAHVDTVDEGRTDASRFPSRWRRDSYALVPRQDYAIRLGKPVSIGAPTAEG
jgi:hypothetical protein